jgi:O-antigen/teichoic acid export membrane protein
MIILFVVVILNARHFLAEGTGKIALIVLNITFLQLFAGFVGGSSVVYLVPRRSFSLLAVLSYSWAIISNLLGIILLYYLKLIPIGYEKFLIGLSIMNSFYNITLSLMQGKENIKMFNINQLAQATLLLLLLFCLLRIVPTVQKSIDLYLYAYFFSYFIPFLFSLSFLYKNWDKCLWHNFFRQGKEMAVYGFWTQIANLSQTLSYRLNYYFVEKFSGLKYLGIYELGTKLSEVVWLFPKSIALVQYAHIANCNDTQYARKLTLSLLKIVLLFSVATVLILMSIPSSWIGFIFGAEFAESKVIIYCLAPGIIAISILSILAHHFSGFGKYWVNTVSSGIGFFITLILGLHAIPPAAAINTWRAMLTAGIITSIAYIGSTVFSLFLFYKMYGFSWKDFLITKEECALLKTEIRKMKIR